jgi:hypothetical protein
MTLGDGLIHSVLIVSSVSRERRDGIGALVEERTGPRGVIDVFFGQFDGAEFKACAVHEQMERAGAGPAERRQFQRPASAAYRRMIRNGECEPEQRDDRADEPFCLP